MMLSKERILELAAQAEDFAYMTAISGEECQEAYTKKFALLIVNECKEVMQLALESLIEAKVVAERYQNAKKREQAITALREALAEQEDEIYWIETNKALAKEIIELKKQAEQRSDSERMEPVAWMDSEGFPWSKQGVECRTTPDTYTPLYAAPVSIAKQSETDSSSSSMRTTVRTKDLTDDEIERALDAANVPELPDGYKNLDIEIARAVIAADREKNK